MGKKRNVSASYDDEFDNLVARLRDDKDFADKFITKHGAKTEDHFVQENFSNSKNDDYLEGNEDPHNFRGGLDLNSEDPFNDVRADRQSALDHLGIGAVRTVAKAATEVLKLPGVIGGIGIMAADGLTGGNLIAENEGFETAFNNQWIKFFDGLNEDVKEALPVYIKESVANGDFFTKIGSSATWATEGADGAGYMLGALAPGGLFKYFGGAGKLFGASIKAAKYAKYGKGMEAGRKAMQAAGMTIDKIDSYMIPAFNTIAEAGAESKGVWDAMESRKEDARAEYVSKIKLNDPKFQTAISLKNEELDQLRRAGEISIDEYNQQSANVYNVVIDEMFEKDFKEQKALAAQNTFFKNAVVLAGPNYIQAKLLFGKTPSKVLLDKIGGLGEKSIKNTFKQGTKNFVKGFALEGAEEVGQSAVEHRNIEEGLKFKLGDSRMDDYNPLTFGDDFIKTLGTTEGQVAGFLGGIMGAPMSAVGGYFQDKSNRKQTERLREKINGASTAYADIKNTNIYEQEEYTNPETGEVDYRDKEVDGKKVFIPENVAKVKKALDLVEKDSNEYDNAIEDGDTERIEQFRNRGEFNVISNFIGEDEVTLDALHEHLKVAFPTETSKDISDEQVKVNKTNLERIDKIMSKAKHLQKDFVSFKDMSASILRINHPGITNESTKEEKKIANKHLEDFLNRVGNTFLSERAEEYEAKQTLNKLEKQRLELENNSTVVEIDNPNYIEGVSSELDKKTKTRSNNPRLELVNSLIDKVKEQLKGYEENTNSNIWNNELLNKQFAEEVELRKQIKEDNSPEQVAKNDEVLDKTKNATTVDEIKEIEKTSPKEVLENPIIKKAIVDKKSEIIQVELAQKIEIIREATQEDNDFNDTTVYTDLTGTEGSPITDDLIPKEAENNTPKELKSIQTEEESAGKGAQVISTYRNDDKKGRWKSGDIISFMKEQFSNFLKYEKEPIDKSGKPVTFEINNNPGPNENVNKALILYNELLKRGFTNMTTDEYTLLYEYLPINVRFTPQVNAPIETKRVATFDEETGKWVEKMNISTGLLRTELISNLRKGVSFENMSTTIQSQYKGLLKVDENRFANNNILELDGVKDLKYIRDNLYVVDSFGNLMNIQSGKTKTFINSKLKPNAAGEIYLMIPQANGSEFPLKLNIKKINESEAVLLYEIYKEIITNEKSLNTTISETNPELQEAILKSFEAELNIIGGNKNDIKLQEIVDLLIYQSANIKSQMQVVNGVLYYGENEANINNIKESQNAIINFLVDSKRHQIKINPKFATDNTKTNLKSNSADYLKYLVDNNILSTNAVVNKPTFQGYTNIYLNTGVTVTNQPKSEIEADKADVILPIGTSGSGKSTFIKSLPQENLVIIEPDAMRVEFTGDMNDKSKDKEIYNEAANRAIQAVKQGKQVVFDTTNLTKDKRLPFIEAIKKVLPNANIQYRLMELNPELAKQRIKAQIARGENRANVSDETIDRHAESYKQMLKDIQNEPLTEFKTNEEINAKYDAELKALEEQPKVSESGVEVKTDNTGFDDLFGDKKSDKDIKKDNLKNQIDKLSDDLLFITHITSNNNALNILNSNLLMPAGVSSTTGIVNKTQLLGILNDLIDSKSPHRGYLDMFIGAIDKNTLENNPGKSLQDKLENYLDENFIEDVAKTQLPSELNFGYFTNGQLTLKNNQQNVRNVQENFVSLSEIKGTVENTQLNETQAEVFNENKTPSEMLKDAARNATLIKKYQESLKEGGLPLNARDQIKLNKWAEENPEAYKKICK